MTTPNENSSDGQGPLRGYDVCRECSLPCVVRCSGCSAILDGDPDSCPRCGVEFCKTEEEYAAGDTHKIGLPVCRFHAFNDPKLGSRN